MLSPWFFFPLLCDGGEGFQRPVSSFYAFEGSYKSEHLLALEESSGKKVCPFKLFLTALNLNSHLFGSSVPGCSSDCPQQGPCGQVFLLPAPPPAPLEGQRPVPSDATALLPLCGHQPWGCLGRSLRVWSGKTFLHDVFNCHLIWV